MNFIKQWALGLAVAAVIGAVIMILTPQGSVEKQVKTAVSLFILVAFMYPFVSDIDFKEIFSDIPAASTQSREEEIRASLAAELEAEMKQSIDEALTQNGIKALHIDIDITVTKDGEVSADRVAVTVAENVSTANAKRILKEKVGITAEIEVSD